MGQILTTHLDIVLEDKGRDVQLVWVDLGVQVLDTLQRVNLLLDVRRRKRREKPGCKLKCCQKNNSQMDCVQ